MSKKKILIIVNCVLFLILAVLVAVTLGSQSSDPILDILPTESVSSTENLRLFFFAYSRIIPSNFVLSSSKLNSL